MLPASTWCSAHERVSCGQTRPRQLLTPFTLNLAEEQKDVLDRDKCLEALASLRHAKWFQVRLLLHVVQSKLCRTRDVFSLPLDQAGRHPNDSSHFQ